DRKLQDREPSRVIADDQGRAHDSHARAHRQRVLRPRRICLVHRSRSQVQTATQSWPDYLFQTRVDARQMHRAATPLTRYTALLKSPTNPAHESQRACEDRKHHTRIKPMLERDSAESRLSQTLPGV